MPACAKCPSSARFRFGENATDTNVFYRKLHLLKKQSTGVFKSLLKTFLPYLSSLFPYEQVLQCLKIKLECLTLNQCKMLCNFLPPYAFFKCSDRSIPNCCFFAECSVGFLSDRYIVYKILKKIKQISCLIL